MVINIIFNIMKEKRLRYLDEESFNKLPSEFRDKKLEYHKKYNQIEKREQHLKKLKETYNKKKKDLGEWKKEKTKMYNELFELHNELVPSTFSVSYGGGLLGGKYFTKRSDEINRSWSITMRIKGITFSPYIGTDKDVRNKLNEIEDTDEYWNSKSIIKSGRVQQIITDNETEKVRIQKILKSYIEPNIIKKLVELNKSFNGFEEWCKLYKEKKIKGMDYLK